MKKLVVLYCKQLGINYKKSVRRRISLAHSYSQKVKEKWERLSARGKNGKGKTAVAWFVGFHVAAVFAGIIQLNFQNDKLEVVALNCNSISSLI